MRSWARRLAWGRGGGGLPYKYYIKYPRSHRRLSMAGWILMAAPLVGATRSALLQEEQAKEVVRAGVRCDTTGDR